MKKNLILALVVALFALMTIVTAADIDLTPGQLPGPVNQILETAINSKPSKPATATTNDLAYFDANDDLADSGILYTKVMQTPSSAATGNLAKFTATDQVDDSGIAYTDITAIQTWIKNHVEGLAGVIGTTGCVHANGSTYDFNANVASGAVYLSRAGTDYEVQGFVAAVDFDIAHGGTSPITSVGSACGGAPCTDIVYAVYAKNNAGTISLVSKAGTAAASGAAVAPLDAAITSDVGNAYWRRIFNVKVVADSSSSCAMTFYNTVRPKL